MQGNNAAVAAAAAAAAAAVRSVPGVPPDQAAAAAAAAAAANGNMSGMNFGDMYGANSAMHQNNVVMAATAAAMAAQAKGGDRAFPYPPCRPARPTTTAARAPTAGAR